MIGRRRRIFGLMAGLALFAVPVFAEDLPVPGVFPAAGIDQIDHELTVNLHRVGLDGQTGELLESLKFNGRMLIQRGDPHVNEQGFRQIDFLVTHWKATAWSNVLNTLVVYQLSDVAQPKSTIVAEQKTSDYPATFTFGVIFDPIAFAKYILEHWVGRPMGNGFMEVPPSGNRRTSPLLTSFESARIETVHPTLGTLQFVPQDCGDVAGVTLVTFTPDQKQNLNILGNPI
jgi:hypothetical protein